MDRDGIVIGTHGGTSAGGASLMPKDDDGNGWKEMILDHGRRIKALEDARPIDAAATGELRGGFKTWAMFLMLIANVLLTAWNAYLIHPKQDTTGVQEVLQQIKLRLDRIEPAKEGR